MSIGLSQKIQIEKRKVTSFSELLGDLGGFYSLMATAVIAIIAMLQTKFYTLDQVGQMFRHEKVSKPGKVRSSENSVRMQQQQELQHDLTQRAKIFKKFDLSFCLKFKLTFCTFMSCCFSKKEKILRKMLDRGEKKLEKALDVQHIIEDQRILQGLMKVLKMSKVSRTLLKLQR